MDQGQHQIGANMSGWIKLHRGMLEDPVWTCTTPEQKVVVMTLLMMVNYEPKQWFWGGEKFTLNPGQIVTSLDSIADETGKKSKKLSIQNVRTAIKKLEEMGFLTNVSTKVGRIITIVNWGKYQDLQSQPNKDSNKDLTNDQQRPNKDLTPTKERKKERREEDNTPLTPQGDVFGFDQFWTAYPKKIAKETARKSWLKLKPNDDLSKLIIDHVKAKSKTLDWTKEGGQFIPYPATYLNQRRWEEKVDLAPTPFGTTQTTNKGGFSTLSQEDLARKNLSVAETWLAKEGGDYGV